MPPTSRQSESLRETGTPPPEQVTVRRYLIDDPVTEITQLLHRAYTQVEMGAALSRSPGAGRQDHARPRARRRVLPRDHPRGGWA